MKPVGGGLMVTTITTTITTITTATATATGAATTTRRNAPQSIVFECKK